MANENALKSQFLKRVNKHFDILEEVFGIHELYGKNVRIDFILKPKAELIAHGFEDKWFGVEAKWISGGSGMTAKATKLVWQSMTYAQSLFKVGNETVRLSFVAVLVPDEMNTEIDRKLKLLLGLALYGQVGQMYFYKDNNWGIKFASIYARSLGESFKVNSKMLPKERAGCI